MTTIVQKLRTLDFEAGADWVEDPGREKERVLDDEQVARLLSRETEPAQQDRDRQPAAVIDSADEGDALAGMHGVMVGLGLMVPFWLLVAAIVVLT